MNISERLCLQCNKKLVGRIDKKFCDDYCRNTYNNLQNSDTTNLMRNVNNTLRRNRRILESLLQEEDMRKIQRSKLHQTGYNFTYHTHTYTNAKGQQYQFVYEYGYLELNQDWLLIVKRKHIDE